MKPQYTEINKYGDKFYYSDKAMTIYHREDGPAIEWADGSKHWYLNGKCHRADGPAWEASNGTKAWYINGKCHREDGPAIEYAEGSKSWAYGSKSWYINGHSITEAEFTARTNISISEVLNNIKEAIESLDGEEVANLHNEICRSKIIYVGAGFWKYTGETD